MDKKIFTLISHEAEREKLFIDIAKYRVELKCKGQNESIVILKAIDYTRNKRTLICQKICESNLENSKEILAYFFIGAEKYFFVQQISQDNGFFIFKIPAEIYRLQRRQSYRIKLPVESRLNLKISVVNEAPMILNYRLREISARGCSMLIQKNECLLKKGDSFMASLVWNQNPPIELHAIVRNVIPDSLRKDHSSYGIEFTPLDPILENKLFALTLDIQREVYKRAP